MRRDEGGRVSILPMPDPVVVLAEELRALADAVDAGEVQVVRHKNMFAMLKPHSVLTLDEVREALEHGAKERRAAERALKRSPRR